VDRSCQPCQPVNFCQSCQLCQIANLVNLVNFVNYVNLVNIVDFVNLVNIVDFVNIVNIVDLVNIVSFVNLVNLSTLSPLSTCSLALEEYLSNCEQLCMTVGHRTVLELPEMGTPSPPMENIYPIPLLFEIFCPTDEHLQKIRCKNAPPPSRLSKLSVHKRTL